MKSKTPALCIAVLLCACQGNVVLGGPEGPGPSKRTSFHPTWYPLNDSTSTFEGAIAAGDFNGDKKLDLIATGTHDIVLYANRGDGSFDKKTGLAAAQPKTFTVGDFDKDGLSDVAYQTDTDDLSLPVELYVVFGAKDGTMSRKTLVSPLAEDVTLAVFDFDHDNTADLAMFAGALDIYLNDGGQFDTTPMEYNDIDGRFLAAADLDGDGLIDLLTSWSSTEASGGAAYYQNEGALGWAAPTSVLDESQALDGAAVADFNGDGKMDVAVHYHGDLGFEIAVAYNKGAGKLSALTSFRFDEKIRQLAAGDVNGDRRADLFVLGDSSVRVIINNGDGTWSPAVVFETTGNHPSQFALGDFNDDKALDFAVVTYESVEVFLNTSM